MKTSTDTDTSPQFSTRNFPAESSPSPALSVPGVADVPQSRQRSSLLKHMTLFKSWSQESHPFLTLSVVESPPL